MADFNLNNFRSQMVRDGARPSLFQVQVTFGALAGVEQKLTFMCKATSMPESVLPPVPQRFMGRTVNFAGDAREFGDWNVTIINDEDYGVRKAFENWIDALDQSSTVVRRRSPGLVAPNSYVTSEAHIIQLGKAGDEVARYTMVNAFPIRVGAINLSWDAANQIEEFDVTFKYDFFKTASGSVS